MMKILSPVPVRTINYSRTIRARLAEGPTWCGVSLGKWMLWTCDFISVPFCWDFGGRNNILWMETKAHCWGKQLLKFQTLYVPLVLFLHVCSYRISSFSSVAREWHIKMPQIILTVSLLCQTMGAQGWKGQNLCLQELVDYGTHVNVTWRIGLKSCTWPWMESLGGA